MQPFKNRPAASCSAPERSVALRKQRRALRAVIEACESRRLLSVPAYHLTMDDEFNALNLATGPTSSGWLTSDYYADPFFSGEQEYYALQNGSKFQDAYNPFSVSNGVLSITAQPNKNSQNQPIVTTAANPNYSYDSQPYLSGMLSTSSGDPDGDYPQSAGFSQKYGYFEIRAKLPNAQGMWPAFWLMPDDGSTTTEYDVLEVPIKNGTTNETSTNIYQTAHWGGYTAGDPHVNDQEYDYDPGSIDTSTGFHTYGFAWTPTTVSWYVDGQLTQTQINRSDKPAYMIMNLAIGGSWPGDVDGTTTWPQSMQVDWVHVYSADPNSPAVAPQPNYQASLPAAVGTVDPTGTAYAGLLGGSFELTFSTNGYTADPTGTQWNFAGTSGIVQDGTASMGEPDAPDGTHAAVLEQIGSFSQIFNAPATSGGYTLSFQSANRASAGNNFEVLVDGNVVGAFDPAASDQYGPSQTRSFTLAPGLHNVEFLGLNTSGDDGIAFVDDVQLNATSVLGASIGAPTGLTAMAGPAEGEAILDWNDANTANITGYKIERRVDPSQGGSYAVIATVGATATSFTDTGLSTDPDFPLPYSYRVAAINGTAGVTSAWTTDATVNPTASPLAPPTALQATLTSPTAITLSWLNESYYSTGVLIERKTGSSGTYVQIASLGNANTWADNTVAPGTQYSYRVRVQGAIIAGSAGSYTATTVYSGYSAQVSVTTPSSSTILFDDSLHNGFSYYSSSTSGKGATVVGPVLSPVYSGTTAFGAIAPKTLTKIGLAGGSGSIPVPVGETTLQFAVYLSSGTHVSAFTVELSGNSNRTVSFSNSNSSLWTVDGKAGNSTMTARAWHIVQLNLADAFGSKLIPGTTRLGYFAATTSVASQGIYMDSVSLVSPAPVTAVVAIAPAASIDEGEALMPLELPNDQDDLEARALPDCATR